MEGFINVNKPTGITSYDVIRTIKRAFRLREKIGHTGTLDPLASGVLVICLGRATKKAQLFLSMDKEYVATLKLGVTTDTDDVEGRVIETRDCDYVTTKQVEDIVNGFLGETEQTPPTVSALRWKGEKLYKLHRKGQPVIPNPRKITIKEIKILKIDVPHVTFAIRCSRGTYVRALCRDIGAGLGCGATQEKLERKSVGPFHLAESVRLEDLSKGPLEKYLLPLSVLD